MLPRDVFPASGKVTHLPEKSPVAHVLQRGQGTLGLARNSREEEGIKTRAVERAEWWNPFIFPWHLVEPSSQHPLQLHLAK